MDNAVIVVNVVGSMFDPPLLDQRKWPEALSTIQEALEASYPNAMVSVNDWTQIEYYINEKEARAELEPIVMEAIAAYGSRQKRMDE